MYVDVVLFLVCMVVLNFFLNVGDVYLVVNNLLQLKGMVVLEDIMCVVINIVLGLGGLIDIVLDVGLFKYKEDFGQMLGVWGVLLGLYVVWLLFGLSIVCDIVGFLVDWQMDLFMYWYDSVVIYLLVVLCVVDVCVNLFGVSNVFEQVVVDKYMFLCDVYLQCCCYLIYDGNLLEDQDNKILLDIGDVMVLLYQCFIFNWLVFCC